MLTPRDRMAGLVNFSVVGLSPQSITDTLHRQYKLTIRYVDYRPCPPSARVACAWWNTEEEIDRLVSAVGEIVATVVDQTSVPVGAR
jgi:selenocysteine lyase/cysteine desulfurase